ncbi:MAG: adenylate kinase [bacterium]|nr:adenylate kinase [bacterium]
MITVLIGAPGVGKGTLATILAKKTSFPHIATGDLLREAVANKTELGVKASEYMDQGKLVPNEIVTQILLERTANDDCKNGFLLDGYPRNVAQAETISNSFKVDKVLNFVADKENIIQRLSGRVTCRKCAAVYHLQNSPPKQDDICDKCGGELYQREDQMPSTVKTRLEVYEQETAPLIDFYTQQGILINIDANFGMDEIEKITEQCEKALEVL